MDVPWGGVVRVDGPSVFSGLNLAGQSPAFRRALDLIARVAACDETALVSGETGTGKELAARAIHYLGSRRDCPFVPVNCGGIPDTLLESELFGHERGAFTDARDRRQGLLAEARGGTLFLDEVEAMSARAQVVLLRFLQDQRFRPLGSSAMLTGDVRIVAATNADLEELVRQNLFRRDLLFRLSVLVVPLPPLRERAGDPVLLAQVFLERFSQAYRRPPKRLSAASAHWLARHQWPGNVRELESMILREYLVGTGQEIELGGATAELVLPTVEQRATGATDRGDDAGGVDGPRSFRQAKARAVSQFERAYLTELLRHARGNLSLASRQAEKDRSTLKRLLRRHGIDPAAFGPSSGSSSLNW
jgi:DNA-binding NtrC family response regulator